VKLGKKASEVYGGEVTKKSIVSEWHKQFKEDHKNMEYDERIHLRSHRTDEMFKKCRLLCFYFKYQCHAVRINLDKKKKLHVYKKA
jgi:hypothetical protein